MRLGHLAEHGQYVVADVTIKARSGAVDYNPFDFTAQTRDDRVWEQSATPGFDPTLDSGTLHAGQTVRGNVVFDTATGAVNIRLGSAFGGDVAATWNG